MALPPGFATALAPTFTRATINLFITCTNVAVQALAPVRREALLNSSNSTAVQ